MPLLQIKENFIDVTNDFDWKKWRSQRIWRELREDGEYLFAFVQKNYGYDKETSGQDLGMHADEQGFIGRKEEFVGERGWQKDPNKPNFGERVYNEPSISIEEEWDEKSKTWKKVEYKSGRRIYVYTCKATDSMLENFKKTYGRLDNGKMTMLSFLYGSFIDEVSNMQDFFAKGNAVAIHEKETIKIRQMKQKETA